MWRTIGALAAGIVAWAVVATILNFGLRLWLPGYLAVEHALTFTLAMKVARLSIAAVTSLVAGAVVRAVAPTSRWAPWMTGGIVLLMFLPSHVQLWTRFPIWYHLTFLLTLVPLVVLGAKLWQTGIGSASSRTQSEMAG